ncbi:hypothetical protein TRAPUB_7501 [Trametes pubescens]|uniref:Uncharacterized protein n=1 Tax=Trametes pubescens TaxID=154538 RepID=A0A1M2V3B8_TRAPU|nr:hypothetical protein TRAPUB_7501 [Trametes pubescens]
MLCMNCQLDPKAGNEVGIDAPSGTYTKYRGACGAGTNKSLDAETQQAVCNKNIKIDDFLYGGWDDGAWFYVWTKENAEVTHATNNNNTFTRCPNQLSSSATLSPLGPSSSTSPPPTFSQSFASTVPTPSGNTTSSTASGDHTSSGLSFAASAAIGGVVGVLGVCAIAAAGIFFWRRHKRAQHAYTCPSNAARRSYNVFADKPPETAGVASPYLMSTDTRAILVTLARPPYGPGTKFKFETGQQPWARDPASSPSSCAPLHMTPSEVEGKHTRVICWNSGAAIAG